MVWKYYLLFPLLSTTTLSQFFNISERTWNSEYKANKWSYIKTVAIEKARNSLILVFTDTYSRKNATILDIGCGEGVLYDQLPDNRKKHYLGIDISEAAIEIARKTTGVMQFQTHPAESYVPEKVFDVIIFNEILYYTDHRAILQRYRNYLSPTGVIIISVFFKANVNVIVQTIFKDASRILRNRIDEVVLHGYTQKSTKWKAVPVSFQIGVFKPNR